MFNYPYHLFIHRLHHVNYINKWMGKISVSKFWFEEIVVKKFSEIFAKKMCKMCEKNDCENYPQNPYYRNAYNSVSSLSVTRCDPLSECYSMFSFWLNDKNTYRNIYKRMWKRKAKNKDMLNETRRVQEIKKKIMK